MRLFSGSALLAGLDIQPGYLRLARLTKHYSGYRLTSLDALDLPPHVFDEGKIKHWDKLQAVLTDWVTVMNLRGLAVALHVPASLVRMESVQLPSGLQPVAIEAQIHAHVQREMPRVSEALAVDYVQVDKRSASIDVKFAAARQDYLSCYTDCVNAAGLTVKVVDVDIYAIQRLVCFALDSKSVTACVAVMEGVAALVVFTPHDILFHRSWEIKGVSTLAAQLHQQLQTYATQTRHPVYEQFVYCGPADYIASVRGIVPAMKTFDPLACMTISSNHQEHALFPPHEYLTACGLAMREAPAW